MSKARPGIATASVKGVALDNQMVCDSRAAGSRLLLDTLIQFFHVAGPTFTDMVCLRSARPRLE